MAKCKAWLGDLDDNDNPVKHGRLYMPGVRTCGFRDCVSPDHVVREALPEGFKECSVCGVAKPLAGFGTDRKKRDGLNCECRTCRVARSKKPALKPVF